MKEKGQRQKALVRLVRRQAVSGQEQMVRLLRDLGFHATQSSISRDVRELGLVRVGGRYVPAAELGAKRADGAGPTLEDELVISTEPVGANLLVVKTPPGGANAVAVGLDRRQSPDIAGTVAGDDTIFIAVRSRSAQGRVLALLREASGAGPGRAERR